MYYIYIEKRRRGWKLVDGVLEGGERCHFAAARRREKRYFMLILACEENRRRSKFEFDFLCPSRKIQSYELKLREYKKH